MSDFYYNYPAVGELHLSSDPDGKSLVNNYHADITGLNWPWFHDTSITKVVIDDPITLSADTACLFIGLEHLAEIEGLENLDTSHVTDMSAMFSGCFDLTSLNLSSWDTSQVTDMSFMFFGCRSLRSLDLSNWDVSQVNDTNSMFYNCSSLELLDLSGWNQLSGWGSWKMFNGCPLPETVIADDKTVIARVTELGPEAKIISSQEPTMADEASMAVSIEGGPSEPKPQTR